METKRRALLVRYVWHSWAPQSRLWVLFSSKTRISFLKSATVASGHFWCSGYVVYSVQASEWGLTQKSLRKDCGGKENPFHFYYKTLERCLNTAVSNGSPVLYCLKPAPLLSLGLWGWIAVLCRTRVHNSGADTFTSRVSIQPVTCQYLPSTTIAGFFELASPAACQSSQKRRARMGTTRLS